MKKFFINFIVIIAVIFTIDFLSALLQYQQYISDYKAELKARGSYTQEELKDPPLRFQYSLRLIPFKKYWYDLKKEDTYKKRIYNKNTKKKSILILGCSFAEGARLKRNENLAYKLSRKLDRRTYNQGYSGFGTSETLFLSRNDDFYNDIKIEPEYIVYVYLTDHIRRIFADKYGLDKNVYLSYEEKDNRFIEKNPLFLQLYRLSLLKRLKVKEIYERSINSDYDDYLFNTFKSYIKEVRKNLNNRFPNAKFIIIKYPIKDDEERFIYTTDRWKELESEGFIVYDVMKETNSDMTSSEYTVFDGHPNEKAWELITNDLIKKLGLN